MTADVIFTAWFSNPLVGYILLDPDLQIRHANGRFCSMLNLLPDELQGLKSKHFIHPSDISKWESGCQSLSGAKQDITIPHIRLQGKDKAITHVTATLSTISNENVTDGYLLSLIDIGDKIKAEAALTESEERLRGIFDNDYIGFYKTTPNGEILDVNPALLRILEFKDLEDLLSRNLENEGFDPDYPREQFKSLMEKEGSVKGLEAVWTTKTGRKIYVRENSRAHYNEEGDIRFYEGTIEDISGSVTSALEISEQAEKLRQLVATRDKFFSIIAHDLRNPFNTILGYAEHLEDAFAKLNPEEIKHMISLIHKSSRRAYQLLENLLLWSRMQTGVMRFDPVRFDLCLMVRDTLGLMKSTADRKGVRLSAEMPDSCNVIADENMIFSVLRNLITNAIKFTKARGSVIVSVACADNGLRIKVADTGVGISREELKKMFKTENLTSSPGTDKETGSGLGLILCKEFVEKHGGSISVESTPGKGTTVTFTIPSR